MNITYSVIPIDGDGWGCTGLAYNYEFENIGTLRYEVVPNCVIAHVNMKSVSRYSVITMRELAHKYVQPILKKYDFTEVFILTPFPKLVNALTYGKAKLVQKNLVDEANLYSYKLDGVD